MINIDIGRQLFVDDFLISHSSLAREFHQPQPHPANPVLKPETEWELGSIPFAMPFSDGVWFDPADQKFKLWYAGNEMYTTCYAESEDGINWVRPDLDVVPGTNIVLDIPRDSSTIWLDLNEADSSKRFKALQTCKERKTMRGHLKGFAEGGKYTYSYFTSPDGIHWTKVADSPFSQPIEDRSTFWFDPFRQVWVFSIRGGQSKQEREQEGLRRGRTYKDNSDLLVGLSDLLTGSVNWVGADELDPPHPKYSDFTPQLYNLDAVAYESLMVGLFSVHQGPENNICAEENIQKRNQIMLGYSRDGFHWSRPDRRPFIAAQDHDPDSWDWGNIQSAGGGFLVVHDHLYFYYSGRLLTQGYWDGDAATGLAVLRRDGFASLNADKDGGVVVTRPVTFSGSRLFANLCAPQGRLRFSAQDESGQDIEGFSFAECVPAATDSTCVELTWQSKKSLAELSGRPIKFKFELFDGSLFSFWVSSNTDGKSGGYVAAGGPGFSSGSDV
ncbi:MAG: glycosyl hydrolase family 32 [Hyphomicrobiaceae bacterium]|nr:glycosyl hydrolase family 32 [Hyphomicrobiaceae bacterium]